MKPVTCGFKLKYQISYEYEELINEVETAAEMKYIIGNSKDLPDGESYNTLLTPPNPTYLDNTVKKFLVNTANNYYHYSLYCSMLYAATCSFSYTPSER